MTSYLVTGGAGFIGSHLCQRLLDEGSRVVCVDAFTDLYDPAIKEANARELASNPGFSLIRGDLRDRDLLATALRDNGVETVFHLGALPGVRPSIDRPAEYADVNVRGTIEVLEACRQTGVRRIVVASSSSVYGATSRVPFREDDPADRPTSPYAATKRATELICAAAQALHDFDLTCLRFFTVYGPRQRPEMAIHKFARLIRCDAPVPMHGDGSSSRDYTHVDDIIDGVCGAAEQLGGNSPGFRIYNLGGERPVTLRDLIRMLGELLDREPRIQQLPDQPGDVPRTFADVSRARAELGYSPRVALPEGLGRFVEWLVR